MNLERVDLLQFFPKAKYYTVRIEQRSTGIQNSQPGQGVARILLHTARSIVIDFTLPTVALTICFFYIFFRGVAQPGRALSSGDRRRVSRKTPLLPGYGPVTTKDGARLLTALTIGGRETLGRI
jgi:hypothetical protein